MSGAIHGEILRLNLPVVLQASVSSCGLAATAGVIRYLTGRTIKQRDLASELGHQWTKQGTTMTEVGELLQRHAGAIIDERVRTTFATVASSIQSRLPVLASVHVRPEAGHLVTIVGVMRAAQSAVVVNDPNLAWPLLVPWTELSECLTRVAFVRRHPMPVAPLSAPIAYARSA